MKKKKASGLETYQRKFGYLFTLPFLIGAIAFILYPFVLSVIFSFCKVTAAETGRHLDFIAWENYHYVLRVDPSYNRTLVSTISSTFTSVPVVIIFSFFIASLLNQEFRGRTLARAVLFLPLIVSSPLIGSTMAGEVLSGSIYSQAASAVRSVDFTGAFAEYLEEMKVSDSIISILTGSINNIGNLLALSVIPIILFLAGLQSVSPSLYEAAYVEGATAWEVFWKISLPMISPIILVSIVYCVIDSFTSGNAVMSNVRNVCFNEMNFGQASARAWIYLAIVGVILALVYKIVNHFVFYYDD